MLSFTLNPAKSIYKSPKYREKLIKIYDEKLSQWPTPYESRYLDTKYGKVHVIVSGPEDGYPVMLINASGVAGWSWIFNVGALNKKFRTYAIDNIGEAGKNDLKQPNYIPSNGPEIAAYYADIGNQLGFKKSHVIGASVGGFISSNYAVYAPERVNKLVLLGSMGYGFTLKTIATLIIAQGYPIKPIQDATFTWAFGNALHVRDAFGPWFRLVMKGMVPTPIVPKSLSPEELKRISAPTLTFIGTKDAVVGDFKKAADLAKNIPNSKIRIVESGHLIGAELSGQVNQEIMLFLTEDETNPYPPPIL
jgi:pimeloyl-ACP methyl ester carboxylesterase